MKQELQTFEMKCKCKEACVLIQLTGGQDQILRVWDVDTGACLKELGGHDSKIVTVQCRTKNMCCD